MPGKIIWFLCSLGEKNQKFLSLPSFFVLPVMGEGTAAGCLGVLIVFVDIAMLVGCGILAWNWIDPDSFGRGILFVIIWGVLSSVGHGLVQLLIGGLAALFGD